MPWLNPCDAPLVLVLAENVRNSKRLCTSRFGALERRPQIPPRHAGTGRCARNDKKERIAVKKGQLPKDAAFFTALGGSKAHLTLGMTKGKCHGSRGGC
jgi:hypothetical protein